MKKLLVCITILFCGLLVGAKPKQLVADIPALNYSLIGPEDSAILAYLDSSLLIDDKITVKNFSKLVTFTVWANPGNKNSIPMINWTSLAKTAGHKHSCQFQVPNGKYTLQVTATKGQGSLADNRSGRTVALPFDVEFNNVAILYKIRLATNEEKESGGLGLGNEVYTLEEISRTKLR